MSKKQGEGRRLAPIVEVTHMGEQIVGWRDRLTGKIVSEIDREAITEPEKTMAAKMKPEKSSEK